MIQKIRNSLTNRSMALPFIMKGVLKLAVAAVLTVAWHLYVNKYGASDPLSRVLPVMGVLYLFMAWLGFLRLDGVHMPRVFSYRKKQKDAGRSGSISDHAETEPESDEELTQEEKDICSFLSWLASGLICLAVGVIFLIF